MLNSFRRSSAGEEKHSNNVKDCASNNGHQVQHRKTLNPPMPNEEPHAEAPVSLAKERSRARIGGGVFEFQLAGLVALRLRALCCRRPSLDLRFTLATNVDGANPFDDIVLHLRWCDRGYPRTLTYFVQLKHKENVNVPVSVKDLTGKLSQRNRDFNLRHYFEKFLAAKKMTRMADKKLKPNQRYLREWLLNDYRLVLLTTREVYPKTTRATSPLEFPFEDVLRSGQGETFSFGESDDEIWNMFGKDQSDDYREFLFRLRIFSAQSQVTGLEPLLIHALEEALGGPLPRSERLLSSYVASLQKWWDSDEGTCITQDTDELENILREELHEGLETLVFQNRHYDNLTKRLAGYDATYIVVPGISDSLRCSVIKNVMDKLHPNRYVILTEKTIKEYAQTTLEALCSKICDEVVLSVGLCDEKTSRFVSEMLLDRVCKVRIISSMWDASVYNMLASGRTRCVAWSEQWMLAHLSPSLQNSLLPRCVYFQGLKMPLAELKEAWPSLRRGLRGSALEALATGQHVILGDPLPPLEALYIPRTLEHRGHAHMSLPLDTVVDLLYPYSSRLKGLLGECPSWKKLCQLRKQNVHFLVTGFPDVLLKKLRSDATWEECGESWTPVERSKSKRRRRSWPPARMEMQTKWRSWADVNPPAEAAAGKTARVFRLTFEGGRILYEVVRGRKGVPSATEVNCRPTCRRGETCVHEDVAEVREWGGVSFLASDPGIGKTTYLTRMSHALKEHHPFQWVLLVRISHGALMEDTPEDVQVRDVVDLLTRVAAPEASTTRDCRASTGHFLRDCLRATGGISLLLDGVDEVCPSHKGKALRVLELLLRDMRFQRLWVAARPVLEEDLARTLRCPPLRLRPFSRAQQRQFLLLHWAAGAREAGASVVQRLHERVEQLLDAVRAATERDGRTLCDVPLYMRMLAEAYRSEYAIAGNVRLSAVRTNITRLNILRKFLEETRKVYWAKSDVPMDKIKNLGWDISSEETFLQHHKACATYLIFSADVLGAFLKKIKKTVKEIVGVLEKEKTGIIVKVVDGKPVFIHRVFAEYFAALWFSENYKSLPRSVEALYKGDLEEVRYFFDALLAEDRPLHEAALTGRLEAVLGALRREGQDVDEVDGGGRRALHLASIAGHDGVVRALLDKGADVRARDQVLGWTALRYAYELLRLPEQLQDADRRALRHLVTVDRLLEAGANPREILAFFKQKEILILAIRLDLASIAEAFIRRKGPLFMQRLLRSTYMHEAAQHGARNALAMLLRVGFNVNEADDAGVTPLHLALDRQYVQPLPRDPSNAPSTSNMCSFCHAVPPMHISTSLLTSSTCSLSHATPLMHYVGPMSHHHPGFSWFSSVA